MNDALIEENEIYLQDIICSVVSENPNADDFQLYNKISTMTEIPSLEKVERILELIKLNKIALRKD